MAGRSAPTPGGPDPTDLQRRLHVAAHDLKSPLRTVSLQASMVLEGEMDGTEFAAETLEVVRRLHQLADRLPDLATDDPPES